jgi:hypothetical protein
MSGATAAAAAEAKAAPKEEEKARKDADREAAKAERYFFTYTVYILYAWLYMTHLVRSYTLQCMHAHMLAIHWHLYCVYVCSLSWRTRRLA